MLLRSLLLIALITPILTQTFFADLTSSSSLAGATTTHFLTATFTNFSISSGSYLSLNYTAGWTVTTIARANTGDYCQNTCTLASVTVIPSGNNVRISNLFPSTLTN